MPGTAQRGVSWTGVSHHPGHPLAALEGVSIGSASLRILLGPTSRFGARYFRAHLAASGTLSADPALSGLHNSGPVASYNWIEVAETRSHVTIGQRRIEVPQPELLSAMLAIVPPGGHLMIEYDSAQRVETARSLVAGVPPIATPLGDLLFRIGCGARFKDWQIAEGGSEGPRKLQAYRPPSEEVALRWRREAHQQLQAFLLLPGPYTDLESAARSRAENLLPILAA